MDIPGSGGTAVLHPHTSAVHVHTQWSILPLAALICQTQNAFQELKRGWGGGGSSGISFKKKGGGGGGQPLSFVLEINKIFSKKGGGGPSAPAFSRS